jgi:hypothetical protein
MFARSKDHLAHDVDPQLAALKAANDNLRAANDNEAAQIKTLTARLDTLEDGRKEIPKGGGRGAALKGP